MSITDFLSLIDIGVTIIIGFVITRLVSVRDSRTRAIKDYYIRELTDIKSRINEFYSELFNGRLSSKDIIGWNSTIKNRIKTFDKSVRKTFNLYDATIAEKFFANHKYLTETEEFNKCYSKTSVTFNASTKNAIGERERQLYEIIEQTLYDINNARPRDYIQRKCIEVKSHYGFYRIEKKKNKFSTCLTIAIDWLNSHKTGIIVFIVVILLCYSLFRFSGVVIQTHKETDDLGMIQILDNISSSMVRLVEVKESEIGNKELFPDHYILLYEVSQSDTSTLEGWVKPMSREKQ